MIIRYIQFNDDKSGLEKSRAERILSNGRNEMTIFAGLMLNSFNSLCVFLLMRPEFSVTSELLLEKKTRNIRLKSRDISLAADENYSKTFFNFFMHHCISSSIGESHRVEKSWSFSIFFSVAQQVQLLHVCSFLISCRGWPEQWVGQRKCSQSREHEPKMTSSSHRKKREVNLLLGLMTIFMLNEHSYWITR